MNEEINIKMRCIKYKGRYLGAIKVDPQLTQLVDVVHINLLLSQQVCHLLISTLTTASRRKGKVRTYLVEELLKGPHLLGVDFEEAG